MNNGALDINNGGQVVGLRTWLATSRSTRFFWEGSLIEPRHAAPEISSASPKRLTTQVGQSCDQSGNFAPSSQKPCDDRSQHPHSARLFLVSARRWRH